MMIPCLLMVHGDIDDDNKSEDESGGEQKVYVSGVPVKIIAERVEYVGLDGHLITESYSDFAKKQVESGVRLVETISCAGGIKRTKSGQSF